ncbi:MAG: hypothetical protein ACLQRH_27045 [Acidimicrobiales bacterium]|jgi:hypothetical protein
MTGPGTNSYIVGAEEDHLLGQVYADADGGRADRLVFSSEPADSSRLDVVWHAGSMGVTPQEIGHVPRDHRVLG